MVRFLFTAIQEISLLALRLDELQCRVCACEGSRSGRSNSQSSGRTASDAVVCYAGVLETKNSLLISLLYSSMNHH